MGSRYTIEGVPLSEVCESIRATAEKGVVMGKFDIDSCLLCGDEYSRLLYCETCLALNKKEW